VALPDLSRLDRLTAADLDAFKACLVRVGVTRGSLDGVTPPLAERMPEPISAPIQRWHVRAVEAPLGPILRAFFFADPAPPDALSLALGGELYERMRASGLLLDRPAGVVCALRLNLLHEQWVFTDDLTEGGEAVMGAGATTANLIGAAWPKEKVNSLLDLGCGAGTVALLMAGVCERAVGVDISERALVLSRFNARLSGLDNVEFLESNLFSGVQDRTFDLIVSQPPFVACPPTTDSVTFLHGGTRGDELPLQLLADLPPRLAPAGRAVVLIDLPKYDDVAPTERIRAAIGSAVALDLLVLLGTPQDLDTHITLFGVMLAPTLGPAFEDYVLTHREHLARMKITELRSTFVVLRRTEAVPWTRQVEVRPMVNVAPTGRQIDRMLAAQDLLAAGPEALLSASLDVPPEARFVEQDAKSVRIELPESRLVAPVVTSRAGAELVMEVGRASTVADAVEAVFQRFPQVRLEGPERVLAGVRSALESGLLELREG